MPRNVGTNIYKIPDGTEGFPDTTIESAKYNSYIHDVETDLNAPRPISAGGTGANNANGALANLGAEKASQQINNYDQDVFYPGSFYSAIGAVGAPPAPAGQLATHAFVGIAVSSDAPKSPPDNKNVVIRAYDQSGTTVPGRIYVREKKPDATHPNGLWGPWSIDGTGVAGPVPPTDPPDGLLWWDSEGGHLYVYYNDGNSKQWVIASPFSDPAQFLLKAGDTMLGPLTLQATPTTDLQAANKKYVDDTIVTAGRNNFVELAGDTMSGDLYAPKLQSGIGGTGAIYLGNTGKSLSYDGANFVLNGHLYTNDVHGGTFYPANYYAISFAGAYLAGGGTNTALFVNGTGCYFNYEKSTGKFQWTVNDAEMMRLEYAGGDLIVKGHGWQPGGGDWFSYSDIRIKTVQNEYKAGLAEVVKLRPVSYTYKGNDTPDPPANITATADDPRSKEAVSVPYPNSPHYIAAKDQRLLYGLVAQEMEDTFPEMVSRRGGYIDGTAVNDLRVLDTTPLIFALVNAIKELKTRIEMLEAKP